MGTCRDAEVVIKSAACAASRKTRPTGPRSREAPWLAAVCSPSRRPGASLDLGPLGLVFLGDALAADLITASKSLNPSRNDGAKWNNLANTHSKNASDLGKLTSRPGEGPGHGFGSPKRYKNMTKINCFRSFGAG